VYPEALSLFDYAAAPIEKSPAPIVDVAVATGYRLGATGRDLASSWKTRAADNIAAIRLAHELTQANRPATSDEMRVLARYVGFGATDLAQNLFPVPGSGVRQGWEQIHGDLHALLDEKACNSLARSTQYSHFTPDYLSQAIFDAVVRLGFTGGNAIEPGCGIGLFMAAAPETVANNIKWVGVEMDATAATIARLLQPNASIITRDFTKARFSESADLVIGNPPFAATHVIGEGPAGRMKLRLHDYFIARGLELLRPGGLAAYVTSQGTMDKYDPRARAYMATLAELVGAIRLPQGSMAEQAGTEVVVDLLFFRRLDGNSPDATGWNDTVEIEPSNGKGERPLFVNRYFVEHPEMVLGNHAWTTSPFGPKYTVTKSGAIAEQLAAAIDRLPRNIAAPAPKGATVTRIKPAPVPQGGLFSNATDAPALFADIVPATPRHGTPSLLGLTREERDLDARAYELKEGSYAITGGMDLHQYVNGRLEPVAVKTTRSTPGIYPKAARIIRAFITVRNALRSVIRAQVANDTDANAEAQARLQKAYKSFTGEFGPINLTHTTYHTDDVTKVEKAVQRHPNLAPVLDDPDCWLVASIERYDPDTNTAAMGPIFTQQVIGAVAEREIRSVDDALAAVLDERGHVDIDTIATLLKLDRESTIAELSDRVYAIPDQPGTWVTADEYLSGKVRAKLETAKVFAEDDPRFQRNVEALEACKPKDLNPSDVTARLGSPWIPTSDIEAFVSDVLGIKTKVGHTVGIAAWDVDFAPFINETSATSEWGTVRRHAGKLLHDALNGVIPQIFDVYEEHGQEKRVLNAVDTEAARDKWQKIHEAFSTWIWKDNDRTLRLMRLYNDTYNDIVPREFDGSHLQLRGASSVFSLRPHQKRVVWRIISSGKTYIAHSVGAGKTLTIAAAVMEQRRLGLVKKPMLAVPAHCLGQFTLEWLQLYPTANLLVADESNFATHKRARFIARATTGDWDCIIITHSAFKLIPSPTGVEQRMVEEQLAVLEQMSDQLKHGRDNDRTSRKRLEQRKEAMRMRLEALTGRKDNMVTIQEMGVDQLIIDEAQAFRKLSFITNGGSIKGIDPDGSQRAWDLYVKEKYIESIQPQRAIILSSGTPVTNTLGEMFTIGRYMNEGELQERNIHEFDAWKAMFGETVTELELQPGGQYKPLTRFAQLINVPELVAMFRSYADVVQRKDLKELIALPRIAGGQREIITGEATANFKHCQKRLAERIQAIEERHGKAQPGDDIILSVIGDGRHAAIDVRLVGYNVNEEENKLNLLIRNVIRIYRETSDRTYTDLNGTVSAIRGATQMIFSDLGTVAVAAKRGFSAYEWIRDELIRAGIPRREIAFIQDYKKISDKHALVKSISRGQVRVVLGSTEMMGTGVNAQKRLVALHHLDVPWIPSDIEQREGRIERQGNENEEIGIFAYATPGSMDASMWQANERKSRFIGMAMSGDRSIRRLEDASSQANSFAIAKAIASGNPLLMQKAGLESEIARLRRLRAAHYDDQHSLNTTIAYAKDTIRIANDDIADILNAKAQYEPTKGDRFAMTVFGVHTTERQTAGSYLLGKVTKLSEEHDVIGTLGGLDVVGRAAMDFIAGKTLPEYGIVIGRQIKWTGKLKDTSPIGIVQRLEHIGQGLDDMLLAEQGRLQRAERKIAEAQARIGREFEHDTELTDKLATLKEIERELVEQSRLAEEERRAEAEREKAARNGIEEPTSDDEDIDDIAESHGSAA
jgi:N12 class adenine-specific DNA methylase